MPGRNNAIHIFKEAIAAVQPRQLIPQFIRMDGDMLYIQDTAYPLSDNGRIFVIGTGKASASMAESLEQVIGERIYKGIVTTKYGHALQLKRIVCKVAAHPIPDQQSAQAINATLSLLSEANESDLIICLLSGGASALWADIPPALSMADVQTTFELLQRSGADIRESNIVRKHLSVVKGGQLLRYAPQSKWITLILSDVPGDDMATIASGMTSADPYTYDDALDIIHQYKLTDQIPGRVYEYLMRGNKGLYEETIKPGDPILTKVINIQIGSNHTALEKARETANTMGYRTVIINESMQGDTINYAKQLVEQCKQYKGELPACLLAGGETSLAVTGNGKGGRNQHMALCALQELRKRTNETAASITILCGGTDGTDGPTNAAGAITDVETLSISVQKNIDPGTYIEQCDAYHFFQQTNGLLITGPTYTNVMDLVIALIE